MRPDGRLSSLPQLLLKDCTKEVSEVGEVGEVNGDVGCMFLA